MPADNYPVPTESRIPGAGALLATGNELLPAHSDKGPEGTLLELV